MSDASFTVIVPTRHRPEYVDVAVRSILTSSAELRRVHGVPTRVVVVDDAPDNDDTKDVAAHLGVDYLRVEEHDGRKDPGAAIVMGVQSVDTKYQTIFGDDDIMLVRHLRVAYELLRDGAEVVSSSFMVTDEDLVPVRTVQLLPTDVGDLVAGHTTVNDGSFVAHDDVKDLDWDVALEGQMLVPIWGELMAKGKKFEIATEPTWLYRRHTENISHAALSERDLVLRERARTRLREIVLRELGEIPPSRHAEVRALQEEYTRRISRPHIKLIRRVRNKAARVLAPKPFRADVAYRSVTESAERESAERESAERDSAESESTPRKPAST